MFPRELYSLLVVNGSSQGERLGPAIFLLEAAGYANVRGVAGAVLTPDTAVYYLGEPLRSAAERLADDVGVPLERVAPFGDGPPVAARGDAQLILYLGGS
jgi:hypothetical protein